MTDARTSQVGLPGTDPGDGLDAFSHQGTPKLGADTLPVDASEDPILSEQEPNPGFRQSQPITCPAVIAGKIQKGVGDLKDAARDALKK